MKIATAVDRSKFAKKKKADLTNLKSYVEKLDNDKLKNVPTSWNSFESKVDKLLVPVPVDLSKLSDVVKKDVSNAKIKNIEDRIPDITN